jgi:N-acylneuraminate cytidylyltransferase
MIKALVAVRSGSVRVPNKNIRPFAGKTLLEYKIEQLKHVKGLDGVIVNSDSPEMLGIAASLGAETILRDPYYASNSVSMSDVYRNMAENCRCDYILYANVTNPLTLTESYENAIERFFDGIGSDAFDSLNSGTLVHEFLFRDNRPINYDLLHQPRSQELPEIYALNFAINILKRETMIECRNVVGRKPKIFALPEIEAIDIDTELDFFVAEQLFRKIALKHETIL